MQTETGELDLIPITQLANVLGISRSTFWRMRRDGDVPKPMVRVGRRRLAVRRSDVEAWLKRREAA